MSHLPIPEWGAQVADAEFTDPAKLQARAAKFEGTIKRRNFLEYAASVLCVIAFGSSSFGALSVGEYGIGAAFAFCVVCVMAVLWQLNARGSYRPIPPEESCLAHLRGQYQRQYEALRSVPVWYLGPIALGLASVYTAMLVKFTQVGGLAKAFEGTWLPMLGTAAFLGFVWWLNWHAAGDLKKQIDRIDALA